MHAPDRRTDRQTDRQMLTARARPSRVRYALKTKDSQLKAVNSLLIYYIAHCVYVFKEITGIGTLPITKIIADRLCTVHVCIRGQHML